MSILLFISVLNPDSAFLVVVTVRYIEYSIIMDFEREIYTKLGKNIRKYRLAKNLSQEKLSELLDVNSKFIGHVERVERYISLKKLIQLSVILDVSLSSIFDFKDND